MERDIAGYGRILNSMLTGSPEPQLPVAMSRKHRSAQALRAAALDHARECVSGRPGIQRVATEVRLLAVLARQMPRVALEDPPSLSQIVPTEPTDECATPP